MRVPTIILLCAAAPQMRAQVAPVNFTLMKQQVIEERLAKVSRKMPERRETLLKLFEDAGCQGDNLVTEKVRGSKNPNLICTLKGTDPTAGVYVVGGHYDFIDSGMGAIDDWSGAVLLPSLYESLSKEPKQHDYIFIAFAEEEIGLVGSREYVNKLTKEQQHSIRGMINLECLGLDPPKIWASRADPGLLDAYARSIAALHIPAGAVNVDQVGDDDSHPFRDAKIPTLTIHSITQSTFPLLHTARDKLSAIHPADYYDAYRAVALLLTYLDGPQRKL